MAQLRTSEALAEAMWSIRAKPRMTGLVGGKDRLFG
jgi:hypothetical protein